MGHQSLSRSVLSTSSVSSSSFPSFSSSFASSSSSSFPSSSATTGSAGPDPYVEGHGIHEHDHTAVRFSSVTTTSDAVRAAEEGRRRAMLTLSLSTDGMHAQAAAAAGVGEGSADPFLDALRPGTHVPSAPNGMMIASNSNSASPRVRNRVGEREGTRDGGRDGGGSGRVRANVYGGNAGSFTGGNNNSGGNGNFGRATGAGLYRSHSTESPDSRRRRAEQLRYLRNSNDNANNRRDGIGVYGCVRSMDNDNYDRGAVALAFLEDDVRRVEDEALALAAAQIHEEAVLLAGVSQNVAQGACARPPHHVTITLASN